MTEATGPGGGGGSGEPLRIGVLGAARITDLALVQPARATGHRLVAVAARSPQRAAAFAAQHDVERVHASYDDLLADPDVDVVYNPLPNSWHGHWNAAAARAGKHVLSEKPAAANATEAQAVADVVRAAGVVYLEGFHFPYHPLFHRIHELLLADAVGEVRRVESVLRMPAPPDDDPRWSLELAGGSTMDLGCYSVAALRLLGEHLGGEPAVVQASADERPGRPGVDERLLLECRYPSGAVGLGGSDMAHQSGRDFRLLITGTTGEIEVPMFPVPHEGDSLVLRRAGREPVVEHLGVRSSYTYQLEAFAAAVREGSPVVTDLAFSVANMDMVDRAYELAGLAPRRPAT